jgi:hypothetical protein
MSKSLQPVDPDPLVHMSRSVKKLSPVTPRPQVGKERN